MRIGAGFGVWIAVGVLVASTGCRSKAAPVPPPPGPLQYDEDGDPQTPGAKKAGKRGAGPAGCEAGGTPWDGKQEGCLYEVVGCCYADAEAACAAAGCADGGCQILEFSPAQITCRAR